MAMGAPSKLTDEAKAKVESYLAGGYAEDGKVVPTIEGLAIYLGVVKRTLYYWAEKNKDFLHTLDAIKQMQKDLLINKGLSGDFNATIAKLMLSNHGIQETSVNDLKSSDGSMKPTIVQLVGKDDDS